MPPKTTSEAGRTAPPEPPRDCPLCPRLAGFREHWRQREPAWFNAPVPAFLPPEGVDAVGLLVVGLAPGLRGANRTGRPFTGDYAGDLLFSTLVGSGFARGDYGARPDDGLALAGAAIVNAVRCVPPGNKPLPAEITTCRAFLAAAIAGLPRLRAVLALGAIAHDSTVRALGGRGAEMKFRHGGRWQCGGIALFSSYHCSRLNTNTGVLTREMFAAVVGEVRDYLGPR